MVLTSGTNYILCAGGSVRQRHERHERRSQAASSFCRQLVPAFKIVFVTTIISQLICEGRLEGAALSGSKIFWQTLAYDQYDDQRSPGLNILSYEPKTTFIFMF